MRTIKLFVTFGLLVAVGSISGVPTQSDTAAYQCPPNVNIDLKTGFYPPHDLPSTASLQELEIFAWQSFVALNWPATNQSPTPKSTATPVRGVPNTGATFADSGNPSFYGTGGHLVWETFKHKNELFPPTGSPSPSYDSPPNYQYTKVNVDPHVVDFTLFNNLDEASQIGQNLIFFPANPSASKNQPNNVTPSSDFQILFEAKVNRQEYDYVTKNGYSSQGAARSAAAANTVAYLKSHASTGPTSPYISLPMGDCTIPGPSGEGAIETKAAWRMLTPEQVKSGRYHMARGIYYTGTDDNPTAKNGIFGLVALHIIHKTTNYPYFIFTTFEQVDALTAPDGTPTGLYYVTTYPRVGYVNNSHMPVPPPPPPPAFPNGKLPTPKYLNGYGGPFLAAQYTRPEPVTKTVNDAVIAQIVAQNPDSVWQYYRLLGVQAMPTSDATSPYFHLANIAVETSLGGLQLFQGDIPPPPFSNGLVEMRQMNNAYLLTGPPSPTPTMNMGGCMGCHAVPQRFGYDFSFILLTAGSSKTPDAVGLQTLDVLDKRARRVIGSNSSK